MADYVITTDSNSDVLPEFIKENDLTIIPQYYSFGDTVYGDELNMPPHEFYETMRKGELPKSQANNPAVIRDKFEKNLKRRKKYTPYCIFQCIERQLQQCCHDGKRAAGGLSGPEDHGV